MVEAWKHDPGQKKEKKKKKKKNGGRGKDFGALVSPSPFLNQDSRECKDLLT